MVTWAAAVIGAVVLSVALWAFEPWRLFTSSEVDEPLPQSSQPVAAAAPSGSPYEGRSPSKNSPQPTPTPTPTPQDQVLAQGDFVDAEHTTRGTARVLSLADGRRFVRLEDLETSDGPDLHVWLSDQPSGGAWGSYDDGDYAALGELAATRGNQNYEIPPGRDLAGVRSVVIWCDRFDVAFGTAPVKLG